MKTKLTYIVPIDISLVSKVASDGIAHVGNLIHSIDYDAPIGTPIYAARGGTVIAVKDDSDQGGDDPLYEEHANYIEIEHELDEISEYEHLFCGSSKVQVGDVVQQGDINALAGNTGYSEYPHLHFMVYQKGTDYETMEVQFG